MSVSSENLSFPEKYFLENYNTSVIPDRPVAAVMGMLSVFSLIGTCGNSLVLLVYAKKKFKTPSTVFIIALASCDFVVCLITVPYTMTMEYLFYKVTYDILCKLYFFFITFNIPFSAFIMTAIACDRYFCICHPFMTVFTEKRSKVIVICLSLFAIVLGLITCQFYGVYQQSKIKTIGSNLTSTNLDQLEYTGYCAANEIIFSEEVRLTYQKFYASLFIVAITPVLISYSFIYYAVLKKRKKQVGRWRSSRVTMRLVHTDTTFTTEDAVSSCHIERKRERMNGQTRNSTSTYIKEILYLANVKTAAILFVVALVFIVAFLPSWLMATRIIPYNMVVFYTYFAYNVANPIIYAFMNEIFRQKLWDLLHCRPSTMTRSV